MWCQPGERLRPVLIYGPMQSEVVDELIVRRSDQYVHFTPSAPHFDNLDHFFLNVYGTKARVRAQNKLAVCILQER